MRSSIAVAAAVLAACGCSSSDTSVATSSSTAASSTSSSGAGGGSSASSSASTGGPQPTCDVTGLCTTLTADQLDAACGLGATKTSPSGAATPAADLSSCGYADATGAVASAGRACFHGGATSAHDFWQSQHDEALAVGETQEDLTG